MASDTFQSKVAVAFVFDHLKNHLQLSFTHVQRTLNECARTNSLRGQLLYSHKCAGPASHLLKVAHIGKYRCSRAANIDLLPDFYLHGRKTPLFRVYKQLQPPPGIHIQESVEKYDNVFSRSQGAGANFTVSTSADRKSSRNSVPIHLLIASFKCTSVRGNRIKFSRSSCAWI